MQHNLKISIARESDTGGIVRCKTVSMRERVLRRLFGDTDAAIIEEALSGLDRILRKEPAQTMFGRPYGFYRCRRYAAVNRTR